MGRNHWGEGGGDGRTGIIYIYIYIIVLIYLYIIYIYIHECLCVEDCPTSFEDVEYTVIQSQPARCES